MDEENQGYERNTPSSLARQVETLVFIRSHLTDTYYYGTPEGSLRIECTTPVLDKHAWIVTRHSLYLRFKCRANGKFLKADVRDELLLSDEEEDTTQGNTPISFYLENHVNDVTYSIKACTGKFLGVSSDGSIKQSARRKETERWYIEPMAGIVSLRSFHETWLIGEPPAKNCVSLDKLKTEWAEWKMESLGNGKVAFKSFHDRYLTAEDNGTLTASNTKLGKWEQWKVNHMGKGCYGFKSAHGKWLCGEPKGAVANRDWQREWEVWQVFISDLPVWDDPSVIYLVNSF